MPFYYLPLPFRFDSSRSQCRFVLVLSSPLLPPNIIIYIYCPFRRSQEVGHYEEGGKNYLSLAGLNGGEQLNSKVMDGWMVEEERCGQGNLQVKGQLCKIWMRAFFAC